MYYCITIVNSIYYVIRFFSKEKYTKYLNNTIVRTMIIQINTDYHHNTSLFSS